GFGGADLAINTIDSRQSYEQVLVGMLVSSASESDSGKRVRHIAYGVVELEDAALSGRKGTWIGYTADELMAEAKQKALGLIKNRFEFEEVKRERIAEYTGMSAIRFEFLKQSFEKKIVFSWERALNFEGDSGPYCQYTYSRARRILEKSGEDDGELDQSKITSDIEFELVKSMALSQYAVERTGREFKVNIFIEHINSLCTIFSRFYEQKHVLSAEGAERAARLKLVRSFVLLMEQLFHACGI
ncbi:arginyl-tRNA synthetase, partial [mine drainage metagenome]